MTFSERKGLKSARTVLQRDDLSEALRNSLWNVVFMWMKGTPHFLSSQYEELGEIPLFDAFARHIFLYHFKLPVDEMPARGDLLKLFKKVILKAPWNEVYDFLEAVVSAADDGRLNASLNAILELELAGYRLIGEIFLDVTSEEEVAAIDDALLDSRLPGAAEHLRAAMEHLSNRTNPDYRNSIKESISAVESAAKVLSGNDKATLGGALKTLESKRQIHPALKLAFSNLYGYTSDEGGIRHALMAPSTASAAEAKFFLIACSAFINYMKAAQP